MVGQLARLMGLMTLATFYVVPTAHAADEIGFSNDGVTWGTSLAEPIFDPDFRWVPGDDEIASFYVRNQGPTGAAMTIEARSADTDKLLSNDDIALSARVAGGPWVDLKNGVASESLTSRSITRGDVVRVDVNAVFDAQSTNRSQVKELALNFRVTLQDWRAANGDTGDGSGNGSGSDNSGSLPDTGAQIAAWMIVVALGLMLAGSVIVARRDRSEVTSHG